MGVVRTGGAGWGRAVTLARPAVAGERREGPRRPGRRGAKRAQHVSIATTSHPGRACGARRPPLGMRQHRESGRHRAGPLGPPARDLPAAPRQVTAARRVHRAQPSLALPSDPAAAPRLPAASNSRRAAQHSPAPRRVASGRPAPARLLPLRPASFRLAARPAPPRPAPAAAAAAAARNAGAAGSVGDTAPLSRGTARLAGKPACTVARADWLEGAVSPAGIGPAVGGGRGTRGSSPPTQGVAARWRCRRCTWRPTLSWCV